MVGCVGEVWCGEPTHPRSVRTSRILSSATLTQWLINAAAWEHKCKYTSTTARWDSNPTADQQACDVGAQERGVTWQANAPTLA